jgi:hypothetical protein
MSLGGLENQLGHGGQERIPAHAGNKTPIAYTIASHFTD